MESVIPRGLSLAQALPQKVRATASLTMPDDLLLLCNSTAMAWSQHLVPVLSSLQQSTQPSRACTAGQHHRSMGLKVNHVACTCSLHT